MKNVYLDVNVSTNPNPNKPPEPLLEEAQRSSPYESTNRKVSTGNRCGATLHYKYNRKKHAPHERNLTVMLNKAIDNIGEWLWARGVMWKECQLFSRLKQLRKKDGLDRQQRLEARLADTLLAQTLLRSVNLHTMSLGDFDKDTGRYVAFTKENLWHKLVAALPEDMDYSRKRFDRAWNRFVRAGYIRMEKRTYKVEVRENGKVKQVVRNDVALKYLTPVFFSNVGITRKNLQSARADSLKHIQKKVRKALKSQGPVSVDTLNEKTKTLISQWKESKGIVRQWLEEKARNLQLAKAAFREINDGLIPTPS